MRWTDRFSCQCGRTFRSYATEARHRHNFPALCRKKRSEVNPIIKPRRSVAMSIARLGFRPQYPGDDPLSYVKEQDGRRLSIQLFRSGLWRISHGLLSTLPNGATGCRETTYPTEFHDIPSLKAAIQYELTRQDHKP